MLTTDICRQFGVSLPIWNAGMGGGLAGPALAAAVSNAGGLGVGSEVKPAAEIVRTLAADAEAARKSTAD